MDKKTAAQNLKDAKARLDANTDTTETPAYLAANRAVVDAEKAAKDAGVPIWRR